MTELRRGTLGFCVLALLDDRERYAVELVGELTDSETLAAGAGTLYPMLTRLRTDGMISSTWRESPAGPPRRYYRLTGDGRAALEAFRGEWARFRDAVDELLGKGAS
jgi:PadR family transcriptional regulator PadR